MTKKKPFAFLLFTFYLLTSARPLLTALDFGLVLDQNAEYSGGWDSGADFQYRGILVPRVSGLFGEGGRLYASAGLNFQNGPWAAAPELLRTDINWQAGSVEARLGRMLYSDPLGIAASGLFDGGQLSLDGAAGTFSAGAWYTGLLYKRRAAIEMTPDEAGLYGSELDYGDFANTYFAPRRLLAALGWEHQGLGGRVLAGLDLLGQFGLSGGDRLHSQYLSGRASAPAGPLTLGAGGCIELIEAQGKTRPAFAAELEIAWRSPVQRLSLLGRHSSGEGASTAAFLPLTTAAQGRVLGPKLSGVSLATLEYSARPLRSLSLGLSSSYFIRSDFVTYPNYGGPGHGRFLGGEVYGELFWAPASDVSLSAGGGVFLPSLGNAEPGARALWRVDAGLTISIY